jgi:perosamine synthetase
VLSFNANKIVTTGTGGAVLTNSESAAIRIRPLATTAKLPSPFEFRHDDVGFNYRMGNINAAMGLGQLDRLPETLRRKRQTAEAYRAAFRGMPGVQYVVQPQGSNNWLNRIIVAPELRLPIMEALHREGIESRALFTPLPLLEPYAAFPRDRDELEFAMEAHAQSICLPSGAMCRSP